MGVPDSAVSDLARICRIWDHNGSMHGFCIITNILPASNIHLYSNIIGIRKFEIKCMRGKHFEETRPGRDVCHQHYVRTDKSRTALARACGVGV